MRQTFGWLIKICRKTYSIHFKIMSFNETNKLMIQMVASFQLLSLPFQLRHLSVHAYTMCLLSGETMTTSERVRFCLLNISFRFVFLLKFHFYSFCLQHTIFQYFHLCVVCRSFFQWSIFNSIFVCSKCLCIVFGLRSSCTFMRCHEICIQQINRRVHWLLVVSCFEFDHKMLLFLIVTFYS